MCAQSGCYWRKNASQSPYDFSNGWLERENLMCTPHSITETADRIANSTKCELPKLSSNDGLTWECANESCHLGCPRGSFKNRQIKISYWFIRKTLYNIDSIFYMHPVSGPISEILNLKSCFCNVYGKCEYKQFNKLSETYSKLETIHWLKNSNFKCTKK